ncbi:MAG: class I SAM-dependent methyltransferase [Deltaproteobacteria bacterium]|nr:class I SAM-dependent methyltransferase [Deltaproteobacteria bacterium]
MRERLRNVAIKVITRSYRCKILKPLIWKYITQSRELRFHVYDAPRGDSEQFRKEIASLFEYFGFSSDQFANKTVVDIGAGSHLITSFFQDAKIVAIDPLANRYLKEIPSCGLRKAHKIYSCPAETRIEDLKSAADFAISINVLDHAYEFEAIIDNIYFYLKPGAPAFLSFDCHDYITALHPINLSVERSEKTFESAGFSIAKVSRGLGPVLPCAIPRGSAYGDGEAFSFWLSKPESGSSRGLNSEKA